MIAPSSLSLPPSTKVVIVLVVIIRRLIALYILLLLVRISMVSLISLAFYLPPCKCISALVYLPAIIVKGSWTQKIVCPYIFHLRRDRLWRNNRFLLGRIER